MYVCKHMYLCSNIIVLVCAFGCKCVYYISKYLHILFVYKHLYHYANKFHAFVNAKVWLCLFVYTCVDK